MGSQDSEATKAVLFAFSTVPYLRKGCVLKGGNALKLAYDSPRASVDLDFTFANEPTTDADAQETLLISFCEQLERGLSRAETRYPFTLRIVKALVLPSGQNPRTFPGFEIKIGYADRRRRYAPGEIDRHLQHNTIKLDISLNEIICEDAPFQLGEVSIAIATLNDILAEKLRAILQQVPRKRSRPGDFYDIWYFCTHHAEAVDPGKISAFLPQKTESRSKQEIRISKAAFDDPEVYRRGSLGFERLADLVEGAVPSFEEASRVVKALVSTLDIPEHHE